MKREVFKFLCGLFAGLSLEHAVIAIYMAQGVINQPTFLGRQWGPWSGLVGAAMYLALSLWMGYLGWRKPKEGVRHEP